MGHPPNYMNDGTSNGTTYTYDAEGRLSAVSGSGTSATYFYDPEGQRVESVVNGTVTTYGRDPQGRVVWRDLNQPYAQDIYLNGRHFGSLTTNGDANHTLNSVTYSMVDEVGTDREQFDGSQNALAKITSNPFGDNQITSGNTADSVFYTGKERDAESGLDYFGARYYASNMGRFLSPDFSGSDGDLEPVPYADLKNPQTLNLYSYTQNNPLSHTDPDGHECIINADGSWKDGTAGGESCADVVHNNAVNPVVSAKVTAMDEGQVNPGDLGMGLYAGAGIGRIAGGAALSGLGVLARGLGTIGSDSVEASLTSAAEDAANAVGEGKGPAYGTRVHSAFENNVNAMGNSNLATEVSYKDGVVVPRGTPGSVRLDVVEGQLNAPTAVYDLKTGGAQLTAGRIQQIQSNVPGGSTVPVIQIKP